MYKVKLFVMTNLFMFGIIFSQDGWEHQWWGTPNFWAVSASSDSIAWYAGDGTLIRVTPSYKYWYQVGGDDNEFLFYTSIFTPKGSLGQTCFVTDEWGSIYKTNDFGENWDEKYHYEPGGWFINGIYFWDEYEGIAIGDPVNSDLSKCYIVKTNDGGESWNVVDDVPMLNQSAGIMNWFDVYNDNMWYPIFTNDSTQNNIILFSDNRGESFQSIQVPQDFKQQYFTSTWSDENNGFISNGERLTSFTSNGGIDWSSPFQNEEFQIRYAKCAKQTQILYARHNNEIIRSDDWGANWYSQGTPSNASIWLFDVLDENVVWAAGNNQLILKTTSGGSMLSNINDSPGAIIPREITLEQNYPNPFNPITKIKFSLEQAGLVNISIYNVMGQEVKKVVNNRRLNAGFHTKVWDATDNQGREVPTGNYFYSIEAGDFRQTKKMILLK